VINNETKQRKTFNNEAFFGQDRLNVLLWRLKQNGLEERKL